MSGQGIGSRMEIGKAIKRSEHTEQAALCEWMRARGLRFFAVPNGAHLCAGGRYAQVAKLKAEGLASGAPDLVLVDLANGRPVAIEMKAARGRLSPVQRDMHDVMRRAGWVVLVCHGFEDAKKQIEEIGL